MMRGWQREGLGTQKVSPQALRRDLLGEFKIGKVTAWGWACEKSGREASDPSL